MGRWLGSLLFPGMISGLVTVCPFHHWEIILTVALDIMINRWRTDIKRRGKRLGLSHTVKLKQHAPSNKHHPGFPMWLPAPQPSSIFVLWTTDWLTLEPGLNCVVDKQNKPFSVWYFMVLLCFLLGRRPHHWKSLDVQFALHSNVKKNSRYPWVPLGILRMKEGKKDLSHL